MTSNHRHDLAEPYPEPHREHLELIGWMFIDILSVGVWKCSICNAEGVGSFGSNVIFWGHSMPNSLKRELLGYYEL